MMGTQLHSLWGPLAKSFSNGALGISELGYGMKGGG